MKKNNKTKKKSPLPLVAYAKRTFERYQSMTKKEKSNFITNVQKDFGGHRKSIIRLYARQAKPTTHKAVKGYTLRPTRVERKRGRKAQYDDPDLIWWLQTLWVCMNCPSEKLMHPMLPLWLDKNQDTALTPELKKKILAMSPASIERYLRSYKKANAPRPFCTTRQPKKKNILNQIPVRKLDHKAPCCGYLEGDTVAHCGGSLFGTFAWTLNAIDQKSHWSEQRAFLGNGAQNVLDSTIDFRKRFPFKICHFHSDGGSEFINELLQEYLSNPKDMIVQTRGRAYKSNDQARIEQKNFTHVRLVFGYERIDTQVLVDAMNDIYSNEWRLLSNFFTATRKLTSKVREGAKYKKTFDAPQTPYQRVLEDKSISEVEKQKLKEVFESLNPFDLKKSLDKKMKSFQKMLKLHNTTTEQDKKEAA